MAPGARLEEAPQQDQCDDRGGGVEVEREPCVAHPDTGGVEERGKQDGGDRVGVGCRRADRNQGVHVGGPVAECLPGADVERPTSPELHGRREGELEQRIREDRGEPRKECHPGQPQEERDRQQPGDDDPDPEGSDVSLAGLVALGPGPGHVGDFSLVVAGGSLLDAGHVAGGIHRRG